MDTEQSFRLTGRSINDLSDPFPRFHSPKKARIFPSAAVRYRQRLARAKPKRFQVGGIVYTHTDNPATDRLGGNKKLGHVTCSFAAA